MADSVADSDEWEVVDLGLASLAAEWVSLEASSSSEAVAASDEPAGWLTVDAPQMAELRRAYSNGGAAGASLQRGAAAEEPSEGVAGSAAVPAASTGTTTTSDADGLELLKAVQGFDAAAALVSVSGARAGELNCRDTGSWSLLHWAAFRGHAEACAALLGRSDFSLANTKAQWLWGGGYTALHLAAAKGHTDACQILIASPAFKEVHAKRGGRSAADFARQFRHEATARAVTAALSAK